MRSILVSLLLPLFFAHAEPAPRALVLPEGRDKPLVILGDPKANATLFMPMYAKLTGKPFARLDYTRFDTQRLDKIWGPLTRNLSARPGPLLLAIEMPDPRSNREAYLYFVANLTHRETFFYHDHEYSLREVSYVLFVPDVGTLGPDLNEIYKLPVVQSEALCALALKFSPQNQAASPNP